VAWRAATRADAGPVGRLGRPVAPAEHLDTGQHHTSILEVVGLHRGCGTELEWRGAAPPVAWRAATRADAGPVGRLGRPVALAEHLDTGQHHTSSLEVVGLHRGGGTELEWRGAAPPWPGARPHAPTRGLWAASVARSPWRNRDTGQHHTPSVEVVGLHRGCGTELEWRGAAPPWPGARPHAPTRGPWAASVARSPWRNRDTGQHHTPSLEVVWFAQGLWH